VNQHNNQFNQFQYELFKEAYVDSVQTIKKEYGDSVVLEEIIKIWGQSKW